jgi:hypothetical protein
LRRVANKAGIGVIDAPALANGRLELRHYLREQAISHTMHRYGNILSDSVREFGIEHRVRKTTQQGSGFTTRGH